MPDFAGPIERLIDELKHLPGIGQKTAQRLAFYLLRAAPEDALALADAIRDAKERIRACSICHNITDTDPCLYCVGPARNKKTICVVEEAHNILAVEKTRTYGGLSFETAETPWRARHADRRGHSGGCRSGICGRSHNVEGDGRPTGPVKAPSLGGTRGCRT